MSQAKMTSSFMPDYWPNTYTRSAEPSPETESAQSPRFQLSAMTQRPESPVAYSAVSAITEPFPSASQGSPRPASHMKARLPIRWGVATLPPTTRLNEPIENSGAFRPMICVVTRPFISSEYSDCTIKCGDRQWSVHKAILIPHLQIVDSTLTDLENDREEDYDEFVFMGGDPATIHAMLEYFYMADYEVPTWDMRDEYNGVWSERPETFRLHIAVIRLAAQYHVTRLQLLAQKKLALCASQHGVWHGEDCCKVIDGIYENATRDNDAVKTTLLAVLRKQMPRLLAAPENYPELYSRLRNTPGFMADVYVHTDNTAHAPVYARWYKCTCWRTNVPCGPPEEVPGDVISQLPKW